MKTIEDLARHSGMEVIPADTGWMAVAPDSRQMERFAALVRAQALEEAIAAIAAEHLGETSNQEDQAYNEGVNDCESAIRALKDTP